MKLSPIEPVHTFARRYCIQAAIAWHERHSLSRGDPNSAEAKTLYPHYRALEAILTEVERKTPSDFASIADILAWLLSVGQTAENSFTRMPAHRTGVAQRSITTEREMFWDAVQSFVQKQDWKAEPLPYCRTLSEAESQDLWAALHDRWDVDGIDWFPLRKVNVSAPAVAFDADAFRADGILRTLRNCLALHGIAHVWELRELRPDDDETEIDTALFEPRYNGSEGYWTSPGMEWLVYASHEGTVTLAGEWLVRKIEAAWPEWKSHVSPFIGINQGNDQSDGTA